jgi:hypothetical protein
MYGRYLLRSFVWKEAGLKLIQLGDKPQPGWYQLLLLRKELLASKMVHKDSSHHRARS